MEKDIESGVAKDSGSSPEPSIDKEAGRSSELPKTGTAMSRFIDSFKRNPNARVTTEAVDAEGKPLKDAPPAEPALAMKLKVCEVPWRCFKININVWMN